MFLLSHFNSLARRLTLGQGTRIRVLSECSDFTTLSHFQQKSLLFSLARAQFCKQDGRFKCQRVELPEQHVRRRNHHTEREPLSWPKTSSATSQGNNNSSLQAMPAARQQRSTLLRDQLRGNENDVYGDEDRLEEDNEDEEDGEDEEELDENEAIYGEHNIYKSHFYERQNSLKNRNNRLSLRPTRRLRSTTASKATIDDTLPLVCPQIKCKFEDRIYLQNDCCTYCRNFDFCAQKGKHVCHQDALCINTFNAQASSSFSGANNNLTLEQSPTLNPESMFSCHCKSGFSGDGKFCQDIDECSQKQLNDCDLKTTNCVNLPGTYECRCKRGFKPALFNSTLQEFAKESGSKSEDKVADLDSKITLVHLSNNNETAAADTRTNENKSKQYKGVTTGKSCADINECSDGMLNKCHPQAKCINMQGSYKCRCKHGYLGNGFECHKWFSSDPNVAAYFHRHSPSSSSSGSSTSKLLPSAAASEQQLDNSNNKAEKGAVATAAEPPAHKINMPLETLPDDPNDDQLDDSWATRAQQDDDDSDYDDSYGQDEDGDEGGDGDSDKNEANRSGRKAPKLAESIWEPLKMVAESQISLSQLQQVSFVVDKI